MPRTTTEVQKKAISMTEARKKVRLTTDWMSRSSESVSKMVRTGIQDIEENVLEMIFRYLVKTGFNKTILRSVCRKWYTVTNNFLRHPPQTLVIPPSIRNRAKCKREHDIVMCSKLKQTMNLESLSVMDDPLFEETFVKQFETHLGFLHNLSSLLLDTPLRLNRGQEWKLDVYGHSVALTMYRFLHIIMCQKRNRVFDLFVKILGELTVFNTWRQPTMNFDDGLTLGIMIKENMDLMFFAIKEHLNKAFRCLYRSHPLDLDIYDILAFMRSCCVEENMAVLQIVYIEFRACKDLNWRLESWHFMGFNSHILDDIKKAINDILSICKKDNFREAIQDILSYLEK